MAPVWHAQPCTMGACCAAHYKHVAMGLSLEQAGEASELRTAKGVHTKTRKQLHPMAHRNDPRRPHNEWNGTDYDFSPKAEAILVIARKERDQAQ